MKRGILALVLILSALLGVYGQTSGPIDLILLLDTSSGMSSSYEAVNNYMTGGFLREFLRIGDTFHLIPFSGSQRLDISRRIEGRGDVETIIGRMLLQYPLETSSDVSAALNYTESYVDTLPARPKKIVLITDRAQNAQIDAYSNRFKSRGITFDYVRVTHGQPLTNLPESGRAAAVTGAQPPARGQPAPSQTAQSPVTQATAPSAPPATAQTSTAQSSSAQPAAPATTQTTAAPPTSQTPSVPQTAAQPPAQQTTVPSTTQTTTTQPSASQQSTTPSTAQTTTTAPSTVPQTAQPSAPQATSQTPITPSTTPSTTQTSSSQPQAAQTQPAGEQSGGWKIPLWLLLLIIGLIVAALLAGLIIFLIRNRSYSGPKRPVTASAAAAGEDVPPFTDHSKELAQFAASQSRYRSTPYQERPSSLSLPSDLLDPVAPALLNLFVEDQSTLIGKRNIHSLKSGYSFTVGGGRSDFLIFLVPMPAAIAEVRRDGQRLIFIPRKPKYFPDLGSNEISNCINKTIRVVSDKNYELRIRFQQYQDPLVELNRLLNSLKVPG